MAGKASRENGRKGGRPRGSRSAVTVAREAGMKRAIQAAELSGARVLEELRRLAFADLRDLYDEDGNLKPLHTLTAEQAACIAGLEVVKKNLTAGDGEVDTVIKIKVWDKPRTLEMLAKHFALLTERVEHSGGITIQHEVPD